MPPRVLLDTNILMMAARLGRNLLDEISSAMGTAVEYVVPSFVMDELRRLVETGSPSVSRQASLALRLAEKCSVIEAPLRRGVDESILEVAKLQGLVVATCDGRLRKRLRAEGVAVVYPRNNYFVLEGFLG